MSVHQIFHKILICHIVQYNTVELQMLSAFSTTMFAFAGATSFPTIQSDMKDRRQFFTAVLIAMAGNTRLPQDLFIHTYLARVQLNSSLLRVVRFVRPDGRRQLLHLRKQEGTCLAQLDWIVKKFYDFDFGSRFIKHTVMIDNFAQPSVYSVF